MPETWCLIEIDHLKCSKHVPQEMSTPLYKSRFSIDMYRYCMIYVNIVPEYPFFFPAHQPLFAPRHRTAAAACDPRADATPSPRHLRRVRADLRRRRGRPGRAARRVGRPTPVTPGSHCGKMWEIRDENVQNINVFLQWWISDSYDVLIW